MESLEIESLLGSTYKNKKVFITGHTGFKGSWFIAWLNLLGATIKGYALEADEKSLFNNIAPHLKLESIVADIRDKSTLYKEIIDFQPDFIFHFAAQPLVRRSYEVPAQTFEVNVIGTTNLLECLIDLNKNCVVVVVTTDKVYENRETEHHYKETDVLGGYDPYSASKAASEIAVNSFRNSFFNVGGFNRHKKVIATARAGNVIGGGDWNKDRIIPDFIKSVSLNQPISVRNPNAIRPWQHVLEPLSGYLLLGALLNRHPEQFSGAYNFGPETTDHLTVKQLVEIALTCWGIGTWIDTSDPAQPHEAGLLQLDISKAKNELGWYPKLNSKQAIEWTIEWYKQPNENKFGYTLAQIKNYQQK